MNLNESNANEKCKDCFEFWQSESHKKSNNPFGWCSITNDSVNKNDNCCLIDNSGQKVVRDIERPIDFSEYWAMNGFQ